MKKLLFLLLVIYANTLQAKNYYIAAKGSDLNNGLTATTAWQTISKLNASFGIIAAGDSILFKRGDTFYGSIVISKSGSIGKPLVIGAYGTGVKPVITGFTTILGWTNEGGGIYSKVITSAAQTNMVTINGVQYGMGRYPDGSTYLSYESYSTNTSITDNTLGTSTIWTGAEAAIRKNDWTIDRCPITNHTSNTLTYSGGGSTGTANFGYFIQNDLRTLTTYGEWYHNTSTGKFYMYFGAVDPTTKTVNVATINNLYFANGSAYDYIKVENLNFTGSIGNCINYQYYQDYCKISNCNISFAGGAGISMQSNGTTDTITNNTISWCNKQAIYNYADTNAVITYNTISNIGLIPGQAITGNGYDAIYSTGDGVYIAYNTLKNIGYNGVTIRYSGTANVSYNSIDSACVTIDDGGGIYTSSVNAGVRTFDHNIITNVIGNVNGKGNATSASCGIYLDETATNAVVTNNTVANCLLAGIKLHKAHNNTITDNISYNNGNGINFEDYTSNGNIRNNSIRRNSFIAKTSTQKVVYVYTLDDEVNLFGTFDSNYYARPIADSLSFYLRTASISYQYKKLSQWKSLTSQDVHSEKSPVTISDINNIRFEYNPTNTAKTISLDASYIGVDSTVYSNGSVTLQPYTSIILIKSGPLQVSLKADAGSDISLILPTNSTVLKGSATGTITSYSWTKIAGPSQFTIDNPNSPSTSISSLSVGTYTFQFKVINNLGDSALAKVNVTASSSTVLPVTLLDFSAINNNDKIALQWQVASEINVSHYAIERSSNGQNFENIGNLNANNLADIQVNYNFADNFPLQGINYYRLVMIDMDGTFKYSKTVSVTVKNAVSFSLTNLSISTTNTNIKMGINSNYQQIMQLVVADVSGRIIFTNPVQLHKGFNAIEKGIPAVNTGVYFAKMFTNDLVVSRTVLSGH
jgi:parallel beta-helix repeat protein